LGVIVITGASGLIGGVLAGGLSGDLRLLDLHPKNGVDELDLRDLTGVERAFDGVEKVVHLGAISSEAPFEDILDHNIKTTYNVYEAARRKGVRRVVFASSNHAIGMYPRSERIDAEVPVRPDSYYGVSKAFGEALGRLYAEKWGLEVACIRIGTVNKENRPLTVRHLSTWLSHRDCVDLFRACLEAELTFEIVYGVSRTTRSWWDMRPAEALGYAPQDDCDDYADNVEPDPSEPLGRQGGVFVAPDFSG
jgi:uronate dehydrogenase